MAECPICYTHVALEDEAYAYPCLHRFCLPCLDKWTDAQARHPPAPERNDSSGSNGNGNGSAAAAAAPACALCRRAYTHIIHDAVGVTFRARAVAAAAAAAPQLGGSLQLSAAQRRRRAVYLAAGRPSPRDGDGDGDGDGDRPEGSDGAPAAAAVEAAMAAPHQRSRRRAPPPRPPDDAEVAAWLRRELRALLLDEDVALFVEAAVAALRGCCRPAAVAGTAAAPARADEPRCDSGGRGRERRAPPSVVLPHRTLARPRSRAHNAAAAPIAPSPQPPPPTAPAAEAVARGGGSGVSSTRHPHAFRGYVDTVTVASRLEEALRPVLAGHAARFAAEAAAFVTSGLTVAGHDEATFGRPPARSTDDGGDGVGSKRPRRSQQQPGDSPTAISGGEERSGDDDGGGAEDAGHMRAWHAYGEDIAASSDY